MCTDVLMNDYVGRGKETFTYKYKECKHYTSGEVELTVACRWNTRLSLDPVGGRYLKAASDRSLVHEELWRRLRVRRLAWGVIGRS